MFWLSNPKRREHKKKSCVKTYLYYWIIQNTQVVKSPIENDCLEASIDGPYSKKMVPIFLSQVYAWELHNSMVSPQEEDGMKEARDKKIILSLVIIWYITFFPLNLRICLHSTSPCVSVSVVHLSKLWIYLYYCGMIVICKYLKSKSTIRKTAVLVKCTVIYLKHLRILWCHMVVIPGAVIRNVAVFPKFLSKLNPCAWKRNKALTKKADITGIQYLFSY